MDESCTQLKAILTKEKAILVEEKELQQELLGVECALLQNALECQKCISALKEWNMKKSTSLASLSMHNNSMQSPTTTATTADHMMSPDHVSSDHLMSFDDHELCTSPDIVAELLGVPLEPMGVPLQPMDLSSCREELATLAADKQRLEPQQKRLQKKLKANKTAMSDLQQVGVVSLALMGVAIRTYVMLSAALGRCSVWSILPSPLPPPPHNPSPPSIYQTKACWSLCIRICWR